MSTVTLTFSLPEEKVEVSAAMRAMELAGALHDIYNRARHSLKHGNNHQESLEEIREIAWGLMCQVDGDEPALASDPKPLWPIAHLGIPDRSVRALAGDGIFDVRDLVHHSEADLLKTPNIGRRALNEIKAALADHGLRLRGPLPKNDPHPTEAHQ